MCKLGFWASIWIQHSSKILYTDFVSHLCCHIYIYWYVFIYIYISFNNCLYCFLCGGRLNPPKNTCNVGILSCQDRKYVWNKKWEVKMLSCARQRKKRGVGVIRLGEWEGVERCGKWISMKQQCVHVGKKLVLLSKEECIRERYKNLLYLDYSVYSMKGLSWLH